MIPREIVNMVRLTAGALFIIIGIVNVQFYSPEYYHQGQMLFIAGMVVLSTYETKPKNI